MKSIVRLFTTGSPAINILVILALFFFTFGQLARISLPGQPIYFYLYEIFVYLLTAIFAIRYRRNPFHKLPLIKPIGYFFAWLAATLIISYFWYTRDQNIVATLYFIRLSIYYLFFVYVKEYIKDFPQLASAVRSVVFIAAIGVIISSLTQYFLYQNFGNISYMGWDPHQYRLVGLFFDPPLTVSVLGLFLIFYFLQAQGRYKYLYLAISTIFCILMFLTYSRGGYLALLVTAGVYAVRRLTIRQIGLSVALIVILFIIIPKGENESINLLRTTSIVTRAQDYGVAFDIWKKSPILGIGYNHIRYEKDAYVTEPITEAFNPSHASASFHSSFLMILVTSGVVGLGLYLWKWYQIGTQHDFAKYSIIFLSTLSLTDNVLLHPFILFLLFILLPLYRK